jgi:hypothetical protein
MSNKELPEGYKMYYDSVIDEWIFTYPQDSLFFCSYSTKEEAIEWANKHKERVDKDKGLQKNNWEPYLI